MSDAFDWWAVAGLVLAPLLLLALMPRSRVRELWLRGYLGVLLLLVGWFAPMPPKGGEGDEEG